MLDVFRVAFGDSVGAVPKDSASLFVYGSWPIDPSFESTPTAVVVLIDRERSAWS